MAQGDWLEALNGVRAALAAGDEGLASADGELAAVVDSAYALAKDSLRRLEAVRAGIDAVAQATDLEDRERARLLLERHRDIIATVTAARASAAAKTIELQRIKQRYAAITG